MLALQLYCGVNETISYAFVKYEACNYYFSATGKLVGAGVGTMAFFVISIATRWRSPWHQLEGNIPNPNPRLLPPSLFVCILTPTGKEFCNQYVPTPSSSDVHVGGILIFLALAVRTALPCGAALLWRLWETTRVWGAGIDECFT